MHIFNINYDMIDILFLKVRSADRTRMLVHMLYEETRNKLESEERKLVIKTAFKTTL